MANTYVKIGSTVTVGSGGAATIAFTSIPATYTDLKIVLSTRTNATVGANGYYYDVTFNGTSANRTGKYLEGTGSAANSGSYTLYGVSDASDNTASTFSNGELYIPNYASANNKSASFDSVQENNATASRAILSAGLWSDVSAITSVTFTPGGGSFVQYSSATLYGILKN
jgi:hypothetical protein